MNNLIKDMAYCERPYEKAMSKGVDTLSDAELLAIILRSGTGSTSSVTLANQVLNAHITHKGILGLNFLRREDYIKIKGIGTTKAPLLMAVSELSKRMNLTSLSAGISFDNPASIGEYYMEKCKYFTTEKVFLMLFSNNHSLIKELQLSEGIINQTLVSTRNIYIEALKYEAVRLVLVHNHPSGDPTPSRADIDLTKKVKDSGQLLDILLSDHIIVGHGLYFSMMERGILNEI